MDEAIVSRREDERGLEIERKETHDPPTEILRRSRDFADVKSRNVCSTAGNNQYARDVVEVSYASSVGEGYRAPDAHKSEYSRHNTFVCQVRKAHFPKYFARIGASTAAGTPRPTSEKIAHTNPAVLSIACAIPMTGMCRMQDASRNYIKKDLRLP